MVFNCEREEVWARGPATSLDSSSLPAATTASSLFLSRLCWAPLLSPLFLSPHRPSLWSWFEFVKYDHCDIKRRCRIPHRVKAHRPLTEMFQWPIGIQTASRPALHFLRDLGVPSTNRASGQAPTPCLGNCLSCLLWINGTGHAHKWLPASRSRLQIQDTVYVFWRVG